MTFQQQLLIASYNNRIDENEQLQSSTLNALINDQNLMAESDYEPSESADEEDDQFFEAAIANLDRIMSESDQEQEEERKHGSSDEDYKSCNS